MSDENLTMQQEAAAQLIATGGLQKQEIADKLSISKPTLWKWENKENFKARVNELRRDFKSFGVDLISSKFVTAVDGYWKLIEETDNARVKAEGYRYYIDRMIGKPKSTVDIDTNLNNEDQIDEDIIEAEFEQIANDYDD